MSFSDFEGLTFFLWYFGILVALEFLDFIYIMILEVFWILRIFFYELFGWFWWIEEYGGFCSFYGLLYDLGVIEFFDFGVWCFLMILGI